MTSYVLYRIAMTIAIMVFVVLASIYYHFFPLTAIMLIALALLDDVPIMTIAFDNAIVPPQPVRWELDRVLAISSVLGLLGVIQSFALLYLGDTLHHLERPQLQTMMFLQLVAGGHLMLFVTRARGPFWKPPYPSARLFFPPSSRRRSRRYSCAVKVGSFRRSRGVSLASSGLTTSCG